MNPTQRTRTTARLLVGSILFVCMVALMFVTLIVSGVTEEKDVPVRIVEVIQHDEYCEYDGQQTKDRTIVTMWRGFEEVLCGDRGKVDDRLIIQLPLTHRYFQSDASIQVGVRVP